MKNLEAVEALIGPANADGIEQARNLLARFRTSESLASAIDEFLLDFITLVFVVENKQESFENSLRRLTLLKLERVKRLLAISPLLQDSRVG
ncbi:MULTISPECIES: hypothetical protein [unclassified Mesorhizobium]|uniref:hypothetical protein n=1 Tax=unclassified Mesorhizobium TaxID=325217 RepID=UPI000F759032|nr:MULTISPECIES: hypothetical protein [unclassified Mesorhizobium]AZO28369.1 hypothetical protein EJ071_13755 [Mesorhizobium sp. M1B.F.Ca.ET.045.04.1.1]TIS45600.1 MAG: hypothetical protein E5W96_31185 [Mesorhizobium sp.]